MLDNIYKTNIHIQPPRDEIQAPNTTDIHIQQIYIYSRLSLSVRWPKLRTRQKKYIHIQQMYIYSRLPLSVKGPKLRTAGLVDAAAVILYTHNKLLEIYGVTNS